MIPNSANYIILQHIYYVLTGIDDNTNHIHHDIIHACIGDYDAHLVRIIYN